MSTAPAPQFYTWNNFRCAYEFYPSGESGSNNLALLLIHPIGVGLSRCFWHRFIAAWREQEQSYPIYNPDLLGCGDSDMPRLAYYPRDWAKQLRYFIETVVKIPVVVIVQGALLPTALRLIELSANCPELIPALVMVGPPGRKLMTKAAPAWQQKLLWNTFFATPTGNAFYRYARRRQFLRSFSERQLFHRAEDVDETWLNTLTKGAANPDSRYAVFSFLAGFWRQDYSAVISKITQAALVVMGKNASTISRNSTGETPEDKIDFYLQHLPNGRGCQIAGRNVLPYESTSEFVTVVQEFINSI